MPRLQTLKPRLGMLATKQVKVLDTKAGATARIGGDAWMATRTRIQLRDRYHCAACGRVRLDHHVDHRIPLEQGGKNDDDNLQLLCSGKGECHAIKTAAEASARARG